MSDLMPSGLTQAEEWEEYGYYIAEEARENGFDSVEEYEEYLADKYYKEQQEYEREMESEELDSGESVLVYNYTYVTSLESE